MVCDILLEKFLTKATTWLQTSSQSKVFIQSYGPPKLQESQRWEFQDYQELGVPGQNDIWVLVSWLGIKYTIRGKVVASPKSRPWWDLWVHVCPSFICAPKCSNYALTNLLFRLCKSVWVSKLLVNLLSPIPELQHTPLPPKWCKLRSVRQLLILSLFSPQTHIWVYQGAWERINYPSFSKEKISKNHELPTFCWQRLRITHLLLVSYFTMFIIMEKVLVVFRNLEHENQILCEFVVHLQTNQTSTYLACVSAT